MFSVTGTSYVLLGLTGLPELAHCHGIGSVLWSQATTFPDVSGCA